jgi:hypothetical protein
MVNLSHCGIPPHVPEQPRYERASYHTLKTVKKLAHTNTHIHTCTHTHIHTHTYTHIHTCTHTKHIHTSYTHTHIHTSYTHPHIIHPCDLWVILVQLDFCWGGGGGDMHAYIHLHARAHTHRARTRAYKHTYISRRKSHFGVRFTSSIFRCEDFDRATVTSTYRQCMCFCACIVEGKND